MIANSTAATSTVPCMMWAMGGDGWHTPFKREVHCTWPVPNNFCVGTVELSSTS